MLRLYIDEIHQPTNTENPHAKDGHLEPADQFASQTGTSYEYRRYRGPRFSIFPDIETIGLSLVDDVPRVLDVLCAVQANLDIGRFLMAEEFRHSNPPNVIERWTDFMEGAELTFEPHVEFKRRVPQAIGIVRTSDTTPYSNVILESA